MRRRLEAFGELICTKHSKPPHIKSQSAHRASPWGQFASILILFIGIFRLNSSGGAVSSSPSPSASFSGRSSGAFAAADAEADALAMSASPSLSVTRQPSHQPQAASPAPPLAAFLSPTRPAPPAPVSLFYDDGQCGCTRGCLFCAADVVHHQALLLHPL